MRVAHSRQAVTLARIDHVWQLDERPISEFIRVVTRLRSVLSTTCNEDAPIIGLNGTESDGNVKVDVQNLTLFSLMVNVVESNYLLIEFEEVDFVCADGVLLLRMSFILRSVQHPDTGLLKVVCHRKLGVPVEANVLLVFASLLILLRHSVEAGSLAMSPRNNLGLMRTTGIVSSVEALLPSSSS